MGSLGGESDQPKSSAQVVKIRFRLHDGTDVGPVDLSLGATVAEVKSAALAAWPTGRAAPQGVGGLKLILAGRLLDNSVTLADARCPTADLVTMHLVMTPPKTNPKAVAANDAQGAAEASQPSCCGGCVLQ